MTLRRRINRLQLKVAKGGGAQKYLGEIATQRRAKMPIACA
jgi:hypothetical protein